jgi:hypothetical protein
MYLYSSRYSKPELLTRLELLFLYKYCYKAQYVYTKRSVHLLTALVLVVLKVVNMTGKFFMASTNQKIHEIIRAASTACAGIDRCLAQVPEPDSVAIAPIQTAMIIAIAA